MKDVLSVSRKDLPEELNKFDRRSLTDESGVESAGLLCGAEVDEVVPCPIAFRIL